MDTYNTLKECYPSLKQDFFDQVFDKPSLIRHSVDRSTIRSFHASKGYVKKYKPLSLFRVWANEFLSDKNRLKSIKPSNDFQTLHTYVLSDLQVFWSKRDGGKPEFYQFNKLVDLFFKDLVRWEKLDKKTQVFLFNNIHVPLDKFSLDLLRRSDPKLRIRKGVSMNYVNESNYQSLQERIKAICRDLPVIVFDLYAWNETHKPVSSFELIELNQKVK